MLIVDIPCYINTFLLSFIIILYTYVPIENSCELTVASALIMNVVYTLVSFYHCLIC